MEVVKRFRDEKPFQEGYDFYIAILRWRSDCKITSQPRWRWWFWDSPNHFLTWPKLKIRSLQEIKLSTPFSKCEHQHFKANSQRNFQQTPKSMLTYSLHTKKLNRLQLMKNLLATNILIQMKMRSILKITILLLLLFAVKLLFSHPNSSITSDWRLPWKIWILRIRMMM